MIEGLGFESSKAATIKMPDPDGRQVDIIQATCIDCHHVVTRWCYTFGIWRTSTRRTEPMFDGVLVECVCAHVIIGGE